MKRAQLEKLARQWAAEHGLRPPVIVMSPAIGLKVLKWLPAGVFGAADYLCGSRLVVTSRVHDVRFALSTEEIHEAEGLAAAVGIANGTCPFDVIRRMVTVLNQAGTNARLVATVVHYLADHDSRIKKSSKSRTRVVRL